MTNRVETLFFKDLESASFCLERKDGFIFLYKLNEKGVKAKEPLFKIPDGNKTTLIIEVKQ